MTSALRRIAPAAANPHRMNPDLDHAQGSLARNPGLVGDPTPPKRQNRAPPLDVTVVSAVALDLHTNVNL